MCRCDSVSQLASEYVTYEWEIIVAQLMSKNQQTGNEEFEWVLITGLAAGKDGKRGLYAGELLRWVGQSDNNLKCVGSDKMTVDLTNLELFLKDEVYETKYYFRALRRYIQKRAPDGRTPLLLIATEFD